MGKSQIRFLGLLFLFSCSWAQGAIVITNVSFNGSLSPPEITIEADGPVVFNRQDNAQDKQTVFEIKNASILDSAAKSIDTSSFDSNVVMINPYLVPDQPDTVRVVVQLRAPGSIDVVPGNNNLKLLVQRPTGGLDSVDVAGSQKPKTTLDEFIQGKESQKFTGKPVTLQVRDGEVEDVLRLIGEASGFNVIIGEDVKGKITLSLVDVPWDQALDVVLHTMHLGADRSNNILRVGTLANLTAEKTAELNALRAADAAQPRITRVFPVSYAKLTDLQTLLSKFATSANGSGTPGGGPNNPPGGANLGAETSLVQLDERTNSLIVRDTVESLDRIKKLIDILDTQTPQVMIEAKVVQATESFSKALTGSLGFGGTGATSAFASFAGGNPIDPLFGTPGVFTTGGGVSDVTGPKAPGTPIGSFGLSPNLSFLPGLQRLNAVLNWGESEDQLKVISSPKTVVLNKVAANIVEGTPVLVQGTTTQNGIIIPSSTVQQANISLDVTPTVTNDGSVLMDITVHKDQPSGPGIANRQIKTTVLVESGSTLVIGGIYQMSTEHQSSGFPILRKLPLIGALFGSENESTTRDELFFFITPRILNTRESGMAG